MKASSLLHYACTGLFELQAAVAGVDDNGVALAETAFEHLQRKRVEHASLDGPLQRTGTVRRVIPLLDELVFRGIGQADVNLALLESLQQSGNLDVDDALDVLTSKRMEEDHLVDPVEELGPEVRAQRIHDLTPRPLVEGAGLNR